MAAGNHRAISLVKITHRIDAAENNSTQKSGSGWYAISSSIGEVCFENQTSEAFRVKAKYLVIVNNFRVSKFRCAVSVPNAMSHLVRCNPSSKLERISGGSVRRNIEAASMSNFSNSMMERSEVCGRNLAIFQPIKPWARRKRRRHHFSSIQ